MGLSRRKFTKEFKIAALRQVDAGVSIAAVARSCEINPNLLHRWRRDFQQSPEQAFSGLGQRKTDENRVSELERKIGQQALEIDFLKRCLQRIEEQRMLQALNGKPLSIGRSGKK
jgi:transposase